MTLYENLRKDFRKIVEDNKLDLENISIRTTELTTEEAIGITSRKDYPLLNGREVLIEADYKGAKGQAYTDSPTAYTGKIEDVLNLDLEENRNKVLFIASLNAVLSYLGYIEGTIHCKNQEPEFCAKNIVKSIEKSYGPVKIALVGLQPAMLDNLKEDFPIRVLDLNEKTIGSEKYGIEIEDGREKMEEVLSWADIYLVTGSTITNGSIVNYLGQDKPVIFYGTTIAGAAYLNNYKRLCFEAK